MPLLTYRPIILFGLLVVLVGCASTQRNRDKPSAWAQEKSEVGKLQVGSVIGVEKVQFSKNPELARESTDFAAAMYGPLAYAIGPTVTDWQHGDWYYRYAIKLASTGTIVYRNEFFEYNSGECVALREQPLMLVPAYPGACAQ